MVWKAGRSADPDERRRHAEAFVRSLPPVPEYGPLTGGDRAGIEAASRSFTVQRGYPWHGRVMWIRSPVEFHELTAGGQSLLLRRGERLARRVSGLGAAALAAGWMFLLIFCNLAGLVAAIVATAVWLMGIAVTPLLWGWLLGGVLVVYVCVLIWTLYVLPPDRTPLDVRPLRVRMPRGVRPGTSEFRAWLPRDVLGAANRGPDGRTVLQMAGCTARPVRHGEFLGAACGPSADLHRVRFGEPLRRRRRAFDGHLRPHELAWLLERREVAPRRFARALLRTQAQLDRAFAVRMYRDRAVVLEPPVRFHTERLPGGTTRLHCADGPAVEWASGERTYVLHGVAVPEDLVERGWDVERIAAERNTEVRRAAIERMGWETYLERAGLEPMATAPDPGNTVHSLRLYAVPGVDARVLLVTNGSPDRSGTIRQYAELVPSSIEDPVAAAAWQYGVPVDTYRQLQRRT